MIIGEHTPSEHRYTRWHVLLYPGSRAGLRGTEAILHWLRSDPDPSAVSTRAACMVKALSRLAGMNARVSFIFMTRLYRRSRTYLTTERPNLLCDMLDIEVLETPDVKPMTYNNASYINVCHFASLVPPHAQVVSSRSSHGTIGDRGNVIIIAAATEAIVSMERVSWSCSALIRECVAETDAPGGDPRSSL